MSATSFTSASSGTTAGVRATVVSIEVLPLWESPPVIWKLDLDRSVRSTVREQIARKLSVTPSALVGLDVNRRDTILDRPVDSVEITNGLRIAITLKAEINRDFTEFFPRLRRAAVPASAVSTDTAPTLGATLGNLTPLEQDLVDRVKRAGAAPTQEGIAISPDILMAARKPGSSRESLFVHFTTDVRPENEAEISAAVSGVGAFVEYADSLGDDPAHFYAMHAELFFGFDQNDNGAAAFIEETLRDAAERANAADANGFRRAHLYLAPYAGPEQYARFVASSAKRVRLLRTGPPDLHRALVASAAQGRGLAENTAVDAADIPCFTCSRVVSAYTFSLLQREELFWEGLESATVGTFESMNVAAELCETDALDILSRLSINQRDESPSFDGVRFLLERLTNGVREAIARRLMVAHGSNTPFTRMIRASELAVVSELEQIVRDVQPLVESIPDLDAVRQEQFWTMQSALRREIELKYQQYLRGEQSRNVAAFGVMLAFLALHLGYKGKFGVELSSDPRVFRFSNATAANGREAAQKAIRPLVHRYRTSLWKRIARWLFKRGPSKLPRDYDDPGHRMAEGLIKAWWGEALANEATNQRFSLPADLAVGVRELSEQVLSRMREFQESRRADLADLASDPTSILIGTDVTETRRAQEVARADAQSAWSSWIGADGTSKWTQIAYSILVKTGDRPRNIFSITASEILPHAMTAIGAVIERMPEWNVLQSEAVDILDLLRRGVRFDDVNTQRLAVLAQSNRLGPTQMRERTSWILLIGTPINEYSSIVDQLRSKAGELQSTEYRQLEVIVTSAVRGVHLIAECHALPLSAIK